MAIKVGELFGELRLDKSGYDRGLADAEDQAEKSSGRIGGALGKIATFAGGFLAANVVQGAISGLRDYIGSAISEAANLEQSLGAVDQIFEESSEKIHAWAENAAEAAGLSRNSYNELATFSGTVFKGMGVDIENASDMTNDLVQRGADLAAMYGGTTTEAVERLNAAIIGNTIGVRQYGITLTAVDIAEQALLETGKKKESELTQAEKQMAAYTLLMERSSVAQGQFARETDTAAGASARQAAAAENLAARIGEYLIPVQVKWREIQLSVLRVIADYLLPALDWLSDRVAVVVGHLGDFIGDIAWVIQNGAGFNEKLTSGPWASLAEWIGAVGWHLREELIPALRDAAEKWMPIIRDEGQRLIVRIRELGTKVIPVLVEAFQKGATIFTTKVLPALRAIGRWMIDNKPIVAGVAVVLALLLAPFLSIAVAVAALVLKWDELTARFPILQTALDTIINLVQTLRAWFTDSLIPALVTAGEWFMRIGSIVAEVFGAIFEVVSSIVSAVAEVVMSVIGGLLSWWDTWGADIIGFVTETFSQIVGTVSSYLDLLLIYWGHIWSIVRGIAEVAWTVLRFGFEVLVTFLRDTWDRYGWIIVGAFKVIWSVIRDVVETAWEWIKTAISSALDIIQGTFETFAGLLSGDWSRMWDGMKQVAKGAINLIIGGINVLIGALETMINAASTAFNAIPDFEVPGWVPGIGGNSFGLPKIPRAALPRVPTFWGGGIVPGSPGVPRLVLAHGGEEIIRRERAAAARGSVTYQVSVVAPNYVGPEEALAEPVRRVLRQLQGTGAMAPVLR